MQYSKEYNVIINTSLQSRRIHKILVNIGLVFFTSHPSGYIENDVGGAIRFTGSTY